MAEFRPPIRRQGAFYVADMAVCLGPPSIADQGATTLQELFGTPWTLQVEGERNARRVLTFNRWNGSAWIQDGVFEGPLGAQHVALAFDQSARPVVAYEDGLESAAVRYWDEAQQAYVFRSFPGTNPVVINDVLGHFRLEDADVVVFYLSPDRMSVYARIQRERYDTEHELGRLDEPAYLDQVVPLPYQLQLLLSRDAESVALLSELYPVYAEAQVSAGVSPLKGGVYKTNLLVYESEDALNASVSALQGGSYDLNLQQYTGADALDSSLSPLRGGEYRSIYALARGAAGIRSSLSALQGGDYAQNVLPYRPDGAAITGAVGPLRGGSYDEI